MDSLEAQAYYADEKKRLAAKSNHILIEGWIPVTERLPEAKQGWSHSERVFVHYDAEKVEGGKIEGWGVAYYHYDPPYRKPGFVDFHDSRQPTHWMAIPALPA